MRMGRRSTWCGAENIYKWTKNETLHTTVTRNNGCGLRVYIWTALSQQLHSVAAATLTQRLLLLQIVTWQSGQLFHCTAPLRLITVVLMG